MHGRVEDPAATTRPLTIRRTVACEVLVGECGMKVE
jgi:hypothetical protein